MYIILKGFAHVYVANKSSGTLPFDAKDCTHVDTLLPGSVFGEMALLCETQQGRRCATVRSGDAPLELFFVHKDSISSSWLRFPSVRDELIQTSTMRDKWHQTDRLKMMQKAKHDELKMKAHYWLRVRHAKSKGLLTGSESAKNGEDGQHHKRGLRKLPTLKNMKMKSGMAATATSPSMPTTTMMTATAAGKTKKKKKKKGRRRRSL